MLNKIKVIKEILKLPRVQINLGRGKLCYDRYKYFSKPHSKYKIFKHKTIGVALIDLNLFKNYDDYLNHVNGKNSAAYFRRKAVRGGYKVELIDRNKYIDDIYEINTSTLYRQGKKMKEGYLKKKKSYKEETNFKYFGVIKDNKLYAYCWAIYCGEVVILNTLLGHNKYLKDGIMYLLITEIVKDAINLNYSFVMYDTFFGASDGLKFFKNKFLFKPYKVKWSYENE